MFTSISWQQYLYAILLVATIYYLIILMLYYRRDIHHWVMNFPSRRSRLWKFITGRQETDEPDIIGGAEHHPTNKASNGELDADSDGGEADHTNQFTPPINHE